MRLNGVISNPGELNTAITIVTRSFTIDAGGAQKPSYATLETAWAKWVNAHGNEVQYSGGEQVEAMATVTIRYLSGIDETCAIQKGSDTYDIISIDDIRERHEYLELKVRKAKPA